MIAFAHELHRRQDREDDRAEKSDNENDTHGVESAVDKRNVDRLRSYVRGKTCNQCRGNEDGRSGRANRDRVPAMPTHAETPFRRYPVLMDWPRLDRDRARPDAPHANHHHV